MPPKTVVFQASTYWYILSQINFKMYILCTYKYENPVLVHTKYLLFICFRTDMYQYILSMYGYKHFRRVSSRVSGFQMTGRIQLEAWVQVAFYPPATRSQWLAYTEQDHQMPVSTPTVTHWQRRCHGAPGGRPGPRDSGDPAFKFSWLALSVLVGWNTSRPPTLQAIRPSGILYTWFMAVCTGTYRYVQVCTHV